MEHLPGYPFALRTCRRIADTPTKKLFPLPQMRTIREKAMELQSSHEAEVRSMLENYADMRKQIQDYDGLMDAAMNMPPVRKPLATLQ